MDRYFSNKSLTLGKRERTRSALIDSAIATIAQRGFEAASIKEITQAAGLANGTFYNHFDDREALAREAAVVVAIEIAKEVDEATQGVADGLDKVVISTDMVIERALSAPTWGAILVGAFHYLDDFHKDVAKVMHSDLKMARRQGLIELPVTQLLEMQLTALLILAVSLQIRSGRSKSIRFNTAEGILRLLGLTPEDAKTRARKALASPAR